MLFVNKPYGNQVRSFPNDQRSRCVWHSILLKIVCIDSYITVWYTSVGSVASGKRCVKAGAKCKSGSKMSCNGSSKWKLTTTQQIYIYREIYKHTCLYIFTSPCVMTNFTVDCKVTAPNAYCPPHLWIQSHEILTSSMHDSHFMDIVPPKQGIYSTYGYNLISFRWWFLPS